MIQGPVTCLTCMSMLHLLPLRSSFCSLLLVVVLFIHYFILFFSFFLLFSSLSYQSTRWKHDHPRSLSYHLHAPRLPVSSIFNILYYISLLPPSPLFFSAVLFTFSFFLFFSFLFFSFLKGKDMQVCSTDLSVFVAMPTGLMAEYVVFFFSYLLFCFICFVLFVFFFWFSWFLCYVVFPN